MTTDYRRIPEIRCPACGHTLNAVGTMDANVPPPSPGDWSVCMKCQVVSQFRPDLTLERVTKKHLAEMTPDEVKHIAQVIRSIRAVRHNLN